MHTASEYSVCIIKGSGRMDIRVGPKQTMGKTIEDVELTITFSKDVGSVNYSASCKLQAAYKYTSIHKVIFLNCFLNCV